MNKAIKYRLYPNKEQAEIFANTFGCCRKVYNLMLADKIAYYKEHGKILSTTPARYKKDYPFLKEVDSLALANEQLHLQTAYKNFFRDKSIGFPKFKSAKHSRKSYTTNNQGCTVAIFENAVKLPKIGKVKAVIHRNPNADWKVKSATVSQDSDGSFYVSILFAFDKSVEAVPISDNAVGLDYKSDGLYMDSNGHFPKEVHKYYRQGSKKLAKAQRKLKNKTVGSSNYKKQQRKIAKIQKHISNQRKDSLHKLSTEIANQYDIVCVESLNMRSMSNKGFGNGKATMDNGYGMFLDMLAYKLTDRGKYFIKVDKWYPSTQILHCHPQMRVRLKLSERKITCPVCGNTYDRDYNSAVNIKSEGLRILRSQVA